MRRYRRPAQWDMGLQDYTLGNRFYKAGRYSGPQDYAGNNRFYAAADRLGENSLGQYWGTHDYTRVDGLYAEDEGMEWSASEAVADETAASPDGYSHVETNEFFECEDGVREIGPI